MSSKNEMEEMEIPWDFAKLIMNGSIEYDEAMGILDERTRLLSLGQDLDKEDLDLYFD